MVYDNKTNSEPLEKGGGWAVQYTARKGMICGTR